MKFRWKWLYPRGLFGRSLLLVIMPVILLQIVTTYAFYDRHWDSVTKRLARGLVGDIAFVIDQIEENPEPAARQKVFDTAARYMQMIMTFEANAQIGAKNPPRAPFFSLLERTLARVLEDRLGRPFTIDSQTYEDIVEVRIQLDDGVLRVLAREKRLFSNTTYVFLMWMFGSSLILIAVAIVFLRRQIRPIRMLARAADNFGKGRDLADFKPSGAREIRRAGGAFLVMKDRIQRQIAQRTEMLAGVSHDLRTPLTRMKLQLAMLGDSDEVKDLKRDVIEMEKMVQGYLAFARGQDAEQATPTDLSKMLKQVVGDAGRSGADVELASEENIVLPLRQVAFRRCLTNLIDNAIKYAEHVKVAARRLPDSIILTIDDDGPGIPQHKREDVFRPFRRLDEARNQDDGGGVGLGLTIARDVVRGHGGEISLLDSPLGGLRAQIRIPV